MFNLNMVKMIGAAVYTYLLYSIDTMRRGGVDSLILRFLWCVLRAYNKQQAYSLIKPDGHKLQSYAK